MNSLLSFMRSAAHDLNFSGRHRTAETYLSTLNSISVFLNGDDIPLSEINHDFIKAYERHLIRRDLCPNTISFYLRVLRAALNMSVRTGVVPPFPEKLFKNVYTSIDRTVKRAVSISEIRKIRNLKLTDCPQMELARDLFLFSFYTRGMSFVDMAFLRDNNIKSGTLTYHRCKTGQRLDIYLKRRILFIIRKLRIPDSPFLLPIIKRPGLDERRQYTNMEHVVNKWLKEVGKAINLDFPLTMYVARHSWADVARKKGVPLSIISEGMGHTSEKTTRIYLKALNNSEIDRANKSIIYSV